MKKKFNSKIIEINHIGDELRFQREYYNFKNPSKKLSIRVTTKNTNSLFLGDVLQDFLETNFEYMMEPKKTTRENYGEYGTGEDVLYAIEHGHLKQSRKKRNETYNPNAYYLRIYSLFKIYNFMDDFEILTLLKKYNIAPKFEKSEIEKNKIISRVFNEYNKKDLKRLFNLETCRVNVVIKEDFKKVKSDLITLESLLGKSQKNAYETKYIMVLFYLFRKIMIEKFSEISKEDRLSISLELGQETEFVDNIIQNKIKYITYDTLLKIIKYLQLENTDFCYLINYKLDNQESKNRINIYKDVLNFKEL